MAIKRRFRFGALALIACVVALGSAAQERITIKPGAKEANLRRTWKRYVTFSRAHPTYSEYQFRCEWPQYRPVYKPEDREALLTECAKVLTNEGFGTREKALTMLVKYRGYYYVAVDWAFDDLALGAGAGTSFRSRIYYSDPLHLYVFDRDLNHVASFHEGGFIEGRFTVELAPIEFAAVACEKEERLPAPSPIGEPRPEYPPAAKAMGISGAVEVSGIVQPDGTVREVKAIKSSNMLFNGAVVSAFSEATFAPGLCGDTAVPTPFQATVSFRIKMP